MKLVISIDVEEEGLFSGRYPRQPPGVSNIASLRRLEFIPREFGFPLTLLATYPVLKDEAACRTLAHWRERYGAEIGLHLHPWNTPPYLDPPLPEPVPSRRLPRALLQEKLANLVAQAQNSLGAAPASFRMGRYDWSLQLMDILPELGLKVDSSVAPLTPKSGAENFLAPRDPYWFDALPTSGGALLEAPLTMAAVCPATARLAERLSRRLPAPVRGQLLTWFHYTLAVGPQPAWYPLRAMRLAAGLHRARGGRVLTMFFHSSELQPGATRLFPTEAAVQALVAKIRAFLAWLVKTGPVQGVTFTDLLKIYSR